MLIDPYAAVRSANYRAYALGFACSAVGLRMFAFAVLWEVYERTNSEWHLGLTGLARALPVVLLALPGGHAADRFSRKHVLIATQSAFVVCASGMAWWSSGHGPLWVAYALMTLMGCVRAFNGPARGALLPLLVPRDVFHNAVTWTTGIFHVAGLVGPLIAGVVIARSGGAWPVYALAASTSLVFAISATRLSPRAAPRRAGPMTVRSMLSGLGYLRKERVVLGAVLIDCFGVLLGGATALLPVYAKDILHVGPVELGVLSAAPFAGAALMAVVLAHRPPFVRAGRAFLMAVALWALAVIGFGISTNFWLSLFMLLAQGAIDNVSVVIRHVLVQVRTPDELRGRVSAVNTMFIEVSNELGAFESGAVAAWLGPVASVVGGGLGTLAVVAGVAGWIPELRRLGRLTEPEEVAAVPGNGDAQKPPNAQGVPRLAGAGSRELDESGGDSAS